MHLRRRNKERGRAMAMANAGGVACNLHTPHTQMGKKDMIQFNLSACRMAKVTAISICAQRALYVYICVLQWPSRRCTNAITTKTHGKWGWWWRGKASKQTKHEEPTHTSRGEKMKHQQNMDYNFFCFFFFLFFCCCSAHFPTPSGRAANDEWRRTGRKGRGEWKARYELHRENVYSAKINQN